MVTSNAASGYVAKISMLRLNIGSDMLRHARPTAHLGHHVLEGSEHCSARSERSERLERSEHFWTPGNIARVQHSVVALSLPPTIDRLGLSLA